MLDLERLRITFIAGTLGQGGAERQLSYVLRALRECGAGTRVLCLTQGEYWEDRLNRMGVPLTWVGRSKSRLSRLTRIIAELHKRPAEILQSQHFYTNLYAAAAARVLGAREIGTMRSNGISEVKSNGRVLGRLSLLVPRVVVANSQTAIKNAIDIGAAPESMHLLPNVVDTDHFTPPSTRQADAVRLVAVGRLGEEKRLDRFLNVVARLQRLSPQPLRAMIAGDGPKRAELQQQSFELGLLPDRVRFLGSVTDTRSLYRKGDIFVLTSDWEGTPNVVLEAMASGLPVVATRVGGVSEIVQNDQTGFVVDPNDMDGITDSILKLIRNPQLRVLMGREARRYAVANHSPNRLPGLLANLYEMALS